MRLFVAVWPPPELVAAIAVALASDVAPPGDRDGIGGGDAAAPDGGLRWAAADRWHVTLRFLGEADVREARTFLRSVRYRQVVATLGPATGSFGRRVLHVPVAGLGGLAAAVVAATAAVGRSPDDRPFAGHLTLARARARARGGADLAPWCGLPVSGSWRVTELTLVASTPGPGGPRYEVVDRMLSG